MEGFIDAEKPDVLIACGSGSVHDIVRYTACEKKLPFLSYPTAVSVDGFVSGVAAMTEPTCPASASTSAACW